MKDPNLPNLTRLADALGTELLSELVLVGGCAAGLLITDPGHPPVRITRDVDVVVEVVDLKDYYEIERRLERVGFAHDLTEDAPICRWRVDERILDLLAARQGVLPFWNRWHANAVRRYHDVVLPNGAVMRVADAPVFVASKFAAFEDRGCGDYLSSHDIEDILAIVDGREELLQETLAADDELRDYVKASFQRMQQSSVYSEIIVGFFFSEATGDLRGPMLRSRISQIVDG